MKSCLEIKQVDAASKDGFYSIDVNGDNITEEVSLNRNLSQGVSNNAE